MWQQHCEDPSCQSVRFEKKKKLFFGFLDKILSKKTILFISNKVYEDLKATKARQTSPMTKKALDAKELLCDNNTVKTHYVNWSDFLKILSFLDKIFNKNNSLSFQQS